MTITADQIHAMQFKVVFRGYDIRAVDTFLDEVEGELARLTGSPDSRPPARREQVDDATSSGRHATAEGEAPAEPQFGSAATATHAPGAELDVPARAVRTLRLAEQMADQLVASAVAEADQIQAQAADDVAHLRAEAEQLQAEIERLKTLERTSHEAIESLLQAQLEMLHGGRG
jgi:cell division initiation protein